MIAESLLVLSVSGGIACTPPIPYLESRGFSVHPAPDYYVEKFNEYSHHEVTPDTVIIAKKDDTADLILFDKNGCVLGHIDLGFFAES